MAVPLRLRLITEVSLFKSSHWLKKEIQHELLSGKEIILIISFVLPWHCNWSTLSSKTKIDTAAIAQALIKLKGKKEVKLMPNMPSVSDPFYVRWKVET